MSPRWTGQPQRPIAPGATGGAPRLSRVPLATVVLGVGTSVLQFAAAGFVLWQASITGALDADAAPGLERAWPLVCVASSALVALLGLGTFAAARRAGAVVLTGASVVAVLISLVLLGLPAPDGVRLAGAGSAVAGLLLAMSAAIAVVTCVPVEDDADAGLPGPPLPGAPSGPGSRPERYP